MRIDNYLYFCPVRKDGKSSDLEITLIDFNGNVRIHHWFRRYERVTVDVIQRLRNDIDKVSEDLELGNELFPCSRYEEDNDRHPFKSEDARRLRAFNQALDKIIKNRDCIGRLRYFAW